MMFSAHLNSAKVRSVKFLLIMALAKENNGPQQTLPVNDIKESKLWGKKVKYNDNE